MRHALSEQRLRQCAFHNRTRRKYHSNYLYRYNTRSYSYIYSYVLKITYYANTLLKNSIGYTRKHIYTYILFPRKYRTDRRNGLKKNLLALSTLQYLSIILVSAEYVRRQANVVHMCAHSSTTELLSSKFEFLVLLCTSFYIFDQY